MEFGICNLSIAPLREKAAHKSEMVTQILFGETYAIIQNFEDWIQVKLDHDDYYGWLNINQHTALTSEEHNNLTKSDFALTIDFVYPIVGKSSHIPLLLGSKLYNFDGLNCTFKNKKYTFNGQAIDPKTFTWNEELITKTAKKYLNAPYLWGGRSAFGIDCSGFVQNIFRFFNIDLPRDANQQATVGSVVNFIKESKTGDLAFFSNEEGYINHVGMLIGNEKIIHASGKVRIDKIDHYGIYNNESKKYSHKLRIVKRVL